MMSRPAFRTLASSLLLGLAVLGPARVMAAEGGGGSFCLFEIPASPDDGGKQRYLNLTIVQYIEVGDDGVKVVYGGGALGSGYEVKLPAASREEAEDIVARMQKVASLCR